MRSRWSVMPLKPIPPVPVTLTSEPILATPVPLLLTRMALVRLPVGRAPEM